MLLAMELLRWLFGREYDLTVIVKKGNEFLDSESAKLNSHGKGHLPIV
jgi:hypothetical protein